MSKKNDEMMTGVKVQKSRTDKIFDFFLYTISTIIVIVMYGRTRHAVPDIFYRDRILQ